MNTTEILRETKINEFTNKFPLGTFIADEFDFNGKRETAIGVVKNFTLDERDSEGICLNCFAILASSGTFWVDNYLGYYVGADYNVRLATKEEIAKLCKAMNINHYCLQEHIEEYVNDIDKKVAMLRDKGVFTTYVTPEHSNNPIPLNIDLSRLSDEDLKRIIVL